MVQKREHVHVGVPADLFAEPATLSARATMYSAATPRDVLLTRWDTLQRQKSRRSNSHCRAPSWNFSCPVLRVAFNGVPSKASTT
jgi:hypothetical protein